MPALLFVCLHNACRSRIAEAIARRLAPADWVVASAGTVPSLSVDRKAAALLKRKGLRMSPGPPKGLAGLPARRWDYLVHMGCGDPSGLAASKSRVEWLVADPYDGPREVYEALYADLRARVARLVEKIATGDLEKV